MPQPPSFPDPTPYGLALADQVAEALLQNHSFPYAPPSSGGLGFDVVDGRFHYGEVRDGHMQPRQTFATRDAFVRWLAEQSDARFGNPTSEFPGEAYHPVTRQRLLDLVQKRAAFTPAQDRLNALLTRLLTAAGCWGGRLQARFNSGAALVSLSGHHPSGKDVLVYPIELPLKRLLSHYAEETPGSLGGLTIEVDLPQATFHYQGRSADAQDQADAQAAAAAAKTQAQQQQQHRQYLREHLSAEPYGAELAGQVAEALAQGRSLNYSHRDYCGLGFDVQQGRYRYGAVWDGALLEPERTFPNRPAFVGWLAQQSDLALAQLDNKEAWVWNNQPVTRARLLEVVQGLAGPGTAPVS